MDKILAFSILSSSPADIAGVGVGGGYSTRLSWRSGGGKQVQEASKKLEVEEPEQQRPRRAPERKRETRAARFAPEFDGVNCFDSIVFF